MVKEYLRQSAILLKKTGQNEFGESLFSSLAINVRWENRIKVIRDSRGQEVVSEARFFCLEEVKPGDKIEYASRRWEIVSVTESVDLNGAIMYRVAYCK
ncbi:hypothetical protein SAMN02745885_01652 [Carboxydocella sporoproducens DSM 16521]|uniref:Uncharacterized protein n=2 Tax=Carboxydocella TaxID=178898 RepID=A0A1T4QFN1_9FIRM|nr:hypothetical protein CFE_2456 [Carboxydocella thermautotrophica]AVX31805.1 hypothetical protein CTH_2262 [Carboxydocella thermautotrophica]SKA02456.1 hypothetical protein SAMN02745885_01652 [Carboxydocella sporoproducens DSM 16521]